ncbi:exopolysaccharide biosynthesis protein [Methanobacterium sp.]|uniref:exopolysaccharide biosynthesis protein n=1 Tax=Methanobacterium sp. TaxID=2164 RepID=UPI00315985CD
MSETKSNECFSISLEYISSKIPDKGITIGNFLDLMGDRGGLILCLILATPFLIPVSIPGSSIPFGLGIMFIGISRIFNRYLIPKFIMEYVLPKDTLLKILNGTMTALGKLEKYIKPRFLVLSEGPAISRFSISLMVFTSFLLMLPLPVPLTDSLPGYSIFFLVLGILEHDGYFILAGYILTIITTIYFSLIFLFGYAGITFVLSHFGIYMPQF